MKTWITIICFSTIPLLASAQYTMQGEIEFEKRINMHRQIDDYAEEKDGENTWIDNLKARIPKFYSTFFNLNFNTEASIYKPGKETESPMKGFWGQLPATDNIVYTNFKTNQVVASKAFYDSRFLIEDSIRTLRWKIQDEVRVIAGYKCRKAVSKMFDSVVVVAFYTDDIMASGGPEMFAGLPGMILEVAIPRLYTTWIATTVALTAPNIDSLTPPTKGKPITSRDLQSKVAESMKDWKRMGAKAVWWLMI